jgi:hypothetical protein
LAAETLLEGLRGVRWYLQTRSFTGVPEAQMAAFGLASESPRALSNSMVLPRIVALMEAFWRSLFVALLRYSESKEQALGRTRLSTDQLVRIAAGELSVEAAAAEGLSFQSLRKVSQHLRLVAPSLDFEGILRRPYRRRRVSLFESLQAFVEERHRFIHIAELQDQITEPSLLRTLSDTREAARRICFRLAEIYRWDSNNLPDFD